MGELSERPLSEAYSVCRILDANLDRAREGLRIIEEWCRLGVNQRQAAATCKDLRQSLARWHTEDLRVARDTPNDPGIDLSHPQEEQRQNVSQLLQANLCRVQEALRVLEEYSKLERPAMAADCKQMRYQVYGLESELLRHARRQKLAQTPLYLVTAPVENLIPVVEAALQGGVKLVQYRDKQAPDTEQLAIAEQLATCCRQYDALFIVNDRVDIALAVNADGVHLGQQDIPMTLARQILGPQRIVGRSTTNPAEFERAIAEGADYIGVGPFYETPTKVGKAAIGLDYIRTVIDKAPMPWFAIGGIDLDNLAAVQAKGAKQVAVVRAIMQASSPTRATQAFLQQLQSVNSSP